MSDNNCPPNLPIKVEPQEQSNTEEPIQPITLEYYIRDPFVPNAVPFHTRAIYPQSNPPSNRYSVPTPPGGSFPTPSSLNPGNVAPGLENAAMMCRLLISRIQNRLLTETRSTQTFTNLLGDGIQGLTRILVDVAATNRQGERATAQRASSTPASSCGVAASTTQGTEQRGTSVPSPAAYPSVYIVPPLSNTPVSFIIPPAVPSPRGDRSSDIAAPTAQAFQQVGTPLQSPSGDISRDVASSTTQALEQRDTSAPRGSGERSRSSAASTSTGSRPGSGLSLFRASKLAELFFRQQSRAETAKKVEPTKEEQETKDHKDGVVREGPSTSKSADAVRPKRDAEEKIPKKPAHDTREASVRLLRDSRLDAMALAMRQTRSRSGRTDNTEPIASTSTSAAQSVSGRGERTATSRTSSSASSETASTGDGGKRKRAESTEVRRYPTRRNTISDNPVVDADPDGPIKTDPGETAGSGGGRKGDHPPKDSKPKPKKRKGN